MRIELNKVGDPEGFIAYKHQKALFELTQLREAARRLSPDASTFTANEEHLRDVRYGLDNFLTAVVSIWKRGIATLMKAFGLERNDFEGLGQRLRAEGPDGSALADRIDRAFKSRVKLCLDARNEVVYDQPPSETWRLGDGRRRQLGGVEFLSGTGAHAAEEILDEVVAVARDCEDWVRRETTA